MLNTHKSWRYLFIIGLIIILGACNTDGNQSKAVPEVSSDIEAPRLEADYIDGQYIVMFKESEISNQSVEDFSLSIASFAQEFQLQEVEPLPIINGFVAKGLSTLALQSLEQDSRIAHIEQDQYMYASYTQNNATWGLDRIDQRSGRNGRYTYNRTGRGVHAYILDSGVRGSHQEFSGRMGNGYTTIGNSAGDCNGHGTHVAGTVGGTTYGVAKQTTIHSVRVLGCDGRGSNSGIIRAVQWVGYNHTKPAVANMSLGGGVSYALDNAIAAATNRGVLFVVAAGNSGRNACNYSPARSSSAVTVGSTTSSDYRSDFSNYGNCVNIFAPGSSITSAWSTSNYATNTISGTSMASPHVAGVAALYLEANPNASPSAVRNAIISSATRNTVRGAGYGSPNIFLYSLISSGTTPDNGNNPTPNPGNGGGNTGAPCSNCTQYTGNLSAGSSVLVPSRYYYHSGGTQNGYLRGPSGTDFDLDLIRWNGSSWVVVATSQSSDANETIRTSSAAGYYYWRVRAYSGSGNYSFYLER